jgi:hypothetical protein
MNGKPSAAMQPDFSKTKSAVWATILIGIGGLLGDAINWAYERYEAGPLYRTKCNRLIDRDDRLGDPKPVPRPVVWWGVFAFLAAFWGAIGAVLHFLGAF